MFDLLIDPGFWASLFSVTLVQIALGADNLIIITIIANKLPVDRRKLGIYLGLVLAAAFRILFLAIVSFILKYATSVFFSFDSPDPVAAFQRRSERQGLDPGCRCRKGQS